MNANTRIIIEQIITAFHRYGHKLYGEQLTIQEHMLQTACFASEAGEDEFMIAAAVLHDYGHFVHGLAEDIADHGIDGQHEEVGATALTDYFVPEVVEPIRLHVAAKRYLGAVDPAYLSTLSPASTQSLELQGGTFTFAEVEAFERNPYHERAVRLRRYDDAGKVLGMKTPPIEHYRFFLEQALR
ncbi:MAG: HD domain-containing protein [Candidatus Competibacteraceae bacterium]|jgi:phosphonate degradation associated HDIG domain protein|nr:HD domain-containing protein [Candidatus Competibacteraceae bacterium]